MYVIEARNLNKSLGKKIILKDANLYIEKGEILGLVGKSGVGKSVLIRILIGFFKPDSGKVLINLKSEHSLGYSIQENAIYDYMTVNQNLNYFARINKIQRKLRRDRIVFLINSLSLENYKNVLVKNLSGGTKKRVDLACALLNNPEILILDEPLLGLDPELIGNLSNFLIDLNKKGTTIIICSHQTNELAQICSRLVLLKEGQIYNIKKEQLKQIYK
jgi:ABC-2 type transport system ATP-binding protein